MKLIKNNLRKTLQKWTNYLTAGVLALIICFGMGKNFVFAETYQEDMRAVWISTVYNSDYPSVKNDIEGQKKEFIQNLDSLKSVGINTVVVQVRPKADALYPSAINPWSDVLTGIQGQNPGYDPLAFMIQETHNRGMSFHAWLNPYRVTTSGTDLSVLAENHPARLHPDWVLTYNKALYYNPDSNEVKNHIRDTVQELVNNYDLDGIHFDDYFYPTGYPLPEGEDKDGAVAQERRNHVNEMISMVSNAVHSSGKDIMFGVSPMGIWKNSTSDPTGSQTKGLEAYYAVYSDSRAWIENGWVDYIVPQIYWEIGHRLADYSTVMQWWAKEVEGTDVKLYIGQGIYKDTVAQEIEKQLQLNYSNPNVKGSFFFSMRDIIQNREGCRDKIVSFYQTIGNGPSQETPIPTPEIPPAPISEVPSIPVPDPEIPFIPEPEEITIEKQEEELLAPREVTAVAAKAKVLVDGKERIFDAYNILGNNYFKLREIAVALNGTGKQFDVLWDESARAINMKSTTPYTNIEKEVSSNDGKNKTGLLSSDQLLLDGNKVSALAYNINGNNYYKLRDIGRIIDFGVTWSEAANTISIVTITGYEEESVL